MGECPFLVSSTNLRLPFPSIHTVAYPPGFLLLLSKYSFLLPCLYVLQGQPKLIITTVVIDQLLWAISVLASGLFALSLPNASSAYNFITSTCLLSPESLGFWCLETDSWSCEKRVQRIVQNQGFLLWGGHNTEARMDCLLLFRGVLCLDWEDYSLISKAAFPGTLLP